MRSIVLIDVKKERKRLSALGVTHGVSYKGRNQMSRFSKYVREKVVKVLVAALVVGNCRRERNTYGTGRGSGYSSRGRVCIRW